jgi:hypothetical protein
MEKSLTPYVNIPFHSLALFLHRYQRVTSNGKCYLAHARTNGTVSYIAYQLHALVCKLAQNNHNGEMWGGLSCAETKSSCSANLTPPVDYICDTVVVFSTVRQPVWHLSNSRLIWPPESVSTRWCKCQCLSWEMKPGRPARRQGVTESE